MSLPALVRRYSGLASAVIILATILAKHRLQELPSRAYEERPPEAILAANPFRFEEVAARLGLDYRHRLYYPNAEAKSYLPLMAFPPAVAVADVDGDGFMDLYVVQPEPGQPNKLYRNLGGKGFVDIASQVGLDDSGKRQADSMAVWADFDRDGKMDLFQSRFGCHTLFLQDPTTGRFAEHPERLSGYCSNPKAVNVADFNRDGWLDLVFGNYYPSRDLAGYLPLNHVFGFAGRNYTGGQSAVALGSATGFHPPTQGDFGELYRLPAHTTAVGVSDVNGDGWPDLFLANDYAPDRMLLNYGGREFADVTERYIPSREHGFSGMNGDFADFDNEGRLGLYVTNMFIPPFLTSRNILWQNRGDHFTNEAETRGVGRCGWAWTAKFADFDNSGNLDLFVINGKARGARARADTYKSFAFVRNTIATLPPENRWDIALYPDFSGYALSAFQRNCLFWNRDGRFYDVAPESGIGDLEEGQAAALLDYDNDGRIDVVIANMEGPLLLYHNVTPHPGNWVGLNLKGPPGMLTPFGARVILRRPDGKTPTRELYPANGFRGQSDPRIHFGLGSLSEVPPVEVKWPDGRAERFRHLQLNAYQEVDYGTGEPP
jgi:hypothetical protein